MLNFKNHLSSSPKWLVITTVFLMGFLSFFIVWLLLGDFDLMNYDWLVAKNGILWKGLVTNNNYQALIDQYGSLPGFNPDNLEIGKYFSIKNTTGQIRLNQNVFIILFSLLAINLLLPLMICFSFKGIGIDLYPYLVGGSVGCICFIFSGLIDYQFNKDATWATSLWWLLRLGILIMSLVISFVVVNNIVNNFMVHSKNIVNVMKKEDKEMKIIKAQHDKVREDLRKLDQDGDGIEIEEEVK